MLLGIDMAWQSEVSCENQPRIKYRLRVRADSEEGKIDPKHHKRPQLGGILTARNTQRTPNWDAI